MAWLSGIVVELLKWFLPIALKDVHDWISNLITQQKQENTESQAVQDLQKVKADPKSTEQDVKNAEDAALND